jgi:hypothetical protein
MKLILPLAILLFTAGCETLRNLTPDDVKKPIVQVVIYQQTGKFIENADNQVERATNYALFLNELLAADNIGQLAFNELRNKVLEEAQKAKLKQSDMFIVVGALALIENEMVKLLDAGTPESQLRATLRQFALSSLQATEYYL